jgi:putative hydrolase of the HAD superfamily
VASVDTVIFDMDGVLTRYDRPRRLEVLAEGTGVAPAEIERRIFASGFDDRADEGDYTAAEYLVEFSRRVGAPVSLELWLDARRAGMSTNLEVLDLARAAGERATIAMLTNNGPVLREHLAEVAPAIAETFGERALFSCQFGTGKASRAVFELALASLGSEAERSLFIDDSAEYVANARVAGLRVHLFRGEPALRAELAVLRLI